MNVNEIQIKAVQKTAPYIHREYTLYTANGDILAENCDPTFLKEVRRKFYGLSVNRSLVSETGTIEPFNQRRIMVSINNHDTKTSVVGYMWPRDVRKIEIFIKTIKASVTIETNPPCLATNNVLWIDGVQSAIFPRYKRRISDIVLPMA